MDITRYLRLIQGGKKIEHSEHTNAAVANDVSAKMRPKYVL